jgi:hypothetical protein
MYSGKEYEDGYKFSARRYEKENIMAHFKVQIITELLSFAYPLQTPS